MTVPDDDAGPGENKRRAVAAHFGIDEDPLAEFSASFEELSFDPMEMYFEECYSTGEYATGSLENLERTLEQWKVFMKTVGRHPLCPSQDHVSAFVSYCIETRGNKRRTVETKLNTLGRMYRYFQSDPSFPHRLDYDPFKLEKLRLQQKPSGPLPPRPMTLSEIRNVISGIYHIRDRAVILAQFKLGIRSSELCNIQLSELNIEDEELLRLLPSLGGDPEVSSRPNSIFIPSDRPGNKSRRDRILPIDDELADILIGYLFARPDNGEPWLILSKRTGQKMDYGNVNGQIWKPHFRPDFGPTDRYRGVSPHYGRHFFSSWWRVRIGIKRPLVQYMRGDVVTNDEPHPGKESIDHYIHTYYRDIEKLYRENIYKLVP